jgi:hypothetical protein
MQLESWQTSNLINSLNTKQNLIQICLLVAALLPVLTSEAQPTVTAISAGYSHSLFLKSDGSLWAMGDNSYGQLGNGTTDSTNQPEQIISSNVTAIVASQYFSLFLKSNGSLWGMGINSFGQLGDGTTTERHAPVQISAAHTTAIAAGEYHNLFITNGILYAMGQNFYGQLGDGTPTDRHTPVPVTNGVTAIAAGFDHSLFIKFDGSLWAMGYNGNGGLGDGTTDNGTYQTNSPERIVAGGVRAIAGGNGFSLFARNDGSLWVMGWNGDGELGDGTLNSTNLPEQIVAGSPPVVTLIGSASMTNECHFAFTDPGTTNVLGLPVTVTGNLNTNSPGTYLLTYTVTNSLGTNTTNRTVTVMDTTAPVITILAYNPMTVLTNTPFVDPGAIALDACGGSFAVTTNGTVNTAVPGNYTITYSATDSYGNTAMATRIVVVNAQVFYSDNFDSGASDATNWNINLDIGDNAATFGFDYSTVGIPPAPNAGGTTIGVKLEANYTNSTSDYSGTGVSISPKGRSLAAITRSRSICGRILLGTPSSSAMARHNLRERASALLAITPRIPAITQTAFGSRKQAMEEMPPPPRITGFIPISRRWIYLTATLVMQPTAAFTPLAPAQMLRIILIPSMPPWAEIPCPPPKPPSLRLKMEPHAQAAPDLPGIR